MYGRTRLQTSFSWVNPKIDVSFGDVWRYLETWHLETVYSSSRALDPTTDPLELSTAHLEPSAALLEPYTATLQLMSRALYMYSSSGAIYSSFKALYSSSTTQLSPLQATDSLEPSTAL